MSNLYEKNLARVLGEVLEGLAFLFSFPVEEEQDPESPPTTTATVAIGGDWSGHMILRVSAPLLPSLAANMLGLSDEDAGVDEVGRVEQKKDEEGERLAADTIAAKELHDGGDEQTQEQAAEGAGDRVAGEDAVVNIDGDEEPESEEDPLQNVFSLRPAHDALAEEDDRGSTPTRGHRSPLARRGWDRREKV